LLEPGGDPVQVDPGAQDVVAAPDERDQVRFELEGQRQLAVDDVVELAAADGQVGVAELLTPGGGRELGGEPVRPPDEAPFAPWVGIDHALGEGVADGDVATPGMGSGHGSLQSIGVAPWRASRSLVRLNGREPKKPLRADSGEGWVLST